MTKHAPAPRVPLHTVVSPAARDHIRKLADGETKGNVSEMVRRLLNEAVTRRADR